MGPFGIGEIIFLFFVALIVFGPKKLPEIGKTLGKGMREFKKATDDLKSNWEDHIRDSESPVHDLKQTLNEVHAEVTASTNEFKHDITGGVEEAINHEENSPLNETSEPAVPAVPHTPHEETKPDAH